MWLKQTHSIYYFLSIKPNGFLSVRKVRSTTANSIDLTNANTYRQLWSLDNQRLNLNAYQNSFAFKVGLKINEKFVELKINDTHLSRFELVDSSRRETGEKFAIESVKFGNFESLFSKSTYFNKKKSYASFLIYDLAINKNYYLFRSSERDIFTQSESKNGIKLAILDSEQNFVLETDSSQNMSLANVFTYSGSLGDFSVVDEMNNNEAYCRNKKQVDISNESVYSIGNGNFSFAMPAVVPVFNLNNKR